MKKALFLAIALLCAIPLLAQRPDQVLREILGLNDAQLAAVHQLMESRRMAIEPLQVQIRRAEAQLAQILAAESPDPCAAGTLMQSIQSLQRQVAQHQTNFQQGLTALLSEEQKGRLGFIFSVEGALRAAGALHQLGL